MDFKNKYLKYKFKYMKLKEQIGGRIYSSLEHDEHKKNLPFEKNITYQDHKFTCKILKPNNMKEEIGHLRFRMESSDGHAYAMIELDKSKENGIGYGVIIYYNQKPYVYVTLRVFPKYKFCCPMGIQKNPFIKLPVSKSSFLLHSFWASFVREKYPDVEYCLVPPVGSMLHLFIKHLKFNNGHFIPIAAGFFGDLEYLFDEKYNEIKIEQYKNYENFKLIPELTNRLENFDIEKEKIIINEKFEKKETILKKYWDDELKDELEEQLKKDKENYEKIKEDIKEEILEEYNEAIKENIKRKNKRLVKLNEKLSNLINSIKHSDNLTIEKKLNRFKYGFITKIKKYRKDKDDFIFPNPINKFFNKEGIEMITITYKDSTIDLKYSDFKQCIKWNMSNDNNYSEHFWNNPLITIRVDDLNKKWIELTNLF